jgi:toxin ParE1/3/4
MQAVYEISRPAQVDLREIADFSIEQWNEEQAEKYINEFEACFLLLALQPKLGRTSQAIREGLHRHEHGSHVIFYTQIPDGIRIQRVLHRRALPLKKKFIE